MPDATSVPTTPRVLFVDFGTTPNETSGILDVLNLKEKRSNEASPRGGTRLQLDNHTKMAVPRATTCWKKTKESEQISGQHNTTPKWADTTKKEAALSPVDEFLKYHVEFLTTVAPIQEE